MTPAIPAPTTFGLHVALANALRRYGVKPLANRVGAGLRTVENWLTGQSTPTFRHAVAMMQDDELLGTLLRVAGRGDVADLLTAKTALIAAKRALECVDLTEGDK